jgi:hypothetical protein
MTDATQTDADRAFLSYFGELRRSTVANWFLAPVRAGATDPDAIVASVRARCERRVADATRWGSRDAADKGLDILGALLRHPEAARAFARWALRWEALPAAEKAALKEQRAEQGKQAWVATQQATPAQIGYLAKLGHAGPVGDRLAASKLIDELLAQRGVRS